MRRGADVSNNWRTGQSEETTPLRAQRGGHDHGNMNLASKTAPVFFTSPSCVAAVHRMVRWNKATVGRSSVLPSMAEGFTRSRGAAAAKMDRNMANS